MLETALEAVGPAGEPAAGWDHLALVLVICNDLGNFNLNVLRVFWLTAEPGKSVHSLLNLASLDEVAGRIWEEEQTTAKDDTPGELNADGDAIRAGAIVVFGGIVDAGGQQETDGDTELITGNKSATDFTRALEQNALVGCRQIISVQLTISLM